MGQLEVTAICTHRVKVGAVLELAADGPRPPLHPTALPLSPVVPAVPPAQPEAQGRLELRTHTCDQLT